ncbi:MAG TPA: hypothetical protein VN028_05365 [Rhodocyclaceae bacterium]|nr:hypothetical protein [Rhodocyclaceae bacterium]
MHKCMHKLGGDIINKLAIAGFVGVSIAALISCESRQSGPAEQVGKDIDKAAVSVGKQVEKVGENIQDAGKRDAP